MENDYDASQRTVVGTTRVLVAIDDGEIPAVVVRVLNDLYTQADCSLGGIVVLPRSSARKGASRYALWRLIRRIDRRFFALADDPFKPVALPRVFKPLIIGHPQEDTTGPGQAPDFLLNLSTQSISASLARVPSVGVLELFIEDVPMLSCPFAAWQRVAQGWSVTTSSLRLSATDTLASRSLYVSHAGTYPYSVHRNRALTGCKTAAFVRRVISGYAKNNELPAPIERPLQNDSDCSYLSPPGNLQCLGLYFILAARLAKRAFQKKFRPDQWFLGYRFDSQALDDSPGRLKLLAPPRDRLWADPFCIQWKERSLLFFEELPYKTQKGHISVIEFDAAGQPGAPKTVISKPTHLSYPFVFTWQQSLYMVPENAAARKVDLYRYHDNTDKWLYESTLLHDVELNDVTLFHSDDRWWMFGAVAEPGALPNDELYLYQAQSPLGPWQAHKANPVRSDVRNSRPAGRLFYHDGKLMRPVQDCTMYGSALVLNEVLELNLDRFREREAIRLTPNSEIGLFGTHTYNHCDGLTVMDGLCSLGTLSTDSQTVRLAEKQIFTPADRT